MVSVGQVLHVKIVQMELTSLVLLMLAVHLQLHVYLVLKEDMAPVELINAQAPVMQEHMALVPLPHAQANAE
jgi:hypothetical protein